MNQLVIFHSTRALSRHAGGPSGYLFHLWSGLAGHRHAKPAGCEIAWLDDGPAKSGEKPPGQAISWSRPPTCRQRVWHHLLSHGFLRWGVPARLDPLRYRREPAPPAALAALPAHGLVHAHSTLVADRLLQWRAAGAWSGHLILSSHSPEALAIEKANRLRAKGYAAAYCDHVEKTLLARDLAVFRDADAWIFPSPGAMDPYVETLPGFAELARTKRVYFVPTGIVRPVPPAPPAIAKRRMAPASGFQICFIGRHNEVKGYDLFCAAGLRLLDSHPGVQIVCAGTGPLAPPVHPRWHELGQIEDVPALLAASDVLALPNRRTYYDLVLLEALAAGLPVVATATGGNRDVAAETAALSLCPADPESLEQALAAVVAATPGQRAVWRTAALDGYGNRHTETAFALAYAEAVQKIVQHLNEGGPQP
jgi:glycosyltransferase involved in cell wall biosynthesis